MTRLTFGELEFSILKIVRELEHATVREVHKALGTHGSYTTVMTVMTRMAEKGLLTRDKEGKRYIYRASASKHPPTNHLFQRLINKLFEGKPLAMISYLLESDTHFSNEELKEMEALIKKRKAEKKARG